MRSAGTARYCPANVDDLGGTERNLARVLPTYVEGSAPRTAVLCIFATIRQFAS